MDAFSRRPSQQFRRLLRPFRRVWNGVRDLVYGTTDQYLEHARGVIHVGASAGQERYIYAAAALPVVWIEPIPAVYRMLVANIAGFPNQRAIQALVTDADGDERVLHVASNMGMSSSIFDLHQARDIWPDIGYVGAIAMRTETLPSVLRRAGVEVENYDALVLDTQGAELLILQGATSLLPRIRYILTEAAEFEAYKGGATLNQLTDYLRPKGFRLVARSIQAAHPNGQRAYDVLYRRK